MVVRPEVRRVETSRLTLFEKKTRLASLRRDQGSLASLETGVILLALRFAIPKILDHQLM